MKKMILLFLGACSLMACASTNLGDTRGYVYFSSFVRDCGEPVSSDKLDTGETLHTFFKQCQSSSVIQKMEVIESKGIIHKVQITNECPQIFDDYILKHGTPTSQYTLPNGNAVYSFKKTCEYDRTKEEETLVVVGQDNIIQKISTPTECPSYYESPEYKMEQHRQEMERQAKNNKKKIENLEKSLKGLEMDMSLQQTRIKSAQMDIDTAHLWKDADARRQKAEQELKKAQEELKKDEKYKAEWEEEIRRLKSMQYR